MGYQKEIAANAKADYSLLFNRLILYSCRLLLGIAILIDSLASPSQANQPEQVGIEPAVLAFYWDSSKGLVWHFSASTTITIALERP